MKELFKKLIILGVMIFIAWIIPYGLEGKIHYIWSWIPAVIIADYLQS